MHAKPFIGVSFQWTVDRFSQCVSCTPQLPRWLDCVSHNGGIPLLIPPLSEDDELIQIINNVSAFVFAGPIDSVSQGDLHYDRDATGRWEVRLLRLIAESRLPYLGLGTGMHLLNAALGGCLAECPSRQPGHAYGHNPRHKLSTRPGSLMAQIFKSHTVPVGGLRGRVVSELAVGLHATAWTDDRFIEAVESESDDWFAMGVQFLPETDLRGNTDMQLFAALVDEALAADERHATDVPGVKQHSVAIQPFAEFAEPTSLGRN
jgi:putative glutamine amidotransferase